MELVCELVLQGCPHDEQSRFAPVYKRSNRTRLPKILRCFPHCCPTHRPRSYCGSALYLKATLQTASPHQADSDALNSSMDEEDYGRSVYRFSVPTSPTVLQHIAVFGRFELHDPDDVTSTALRIGQQIPLTSLTKNTDRYVIWVRGEGTNSAETNMSAMKGFQQQEHHQQHDTRLFVLNEGNGETHHWEYDWKSGTSQRKRACQHQFRIYVFLSSTFGAISEDDESMLCVVGMAASTPFTLSSYRKQEDDDDEISLPDSNEEQSASTNVHTPPAVPSHTASESLISIRGGAVSSPLGATHLSPAARERLLAHQHQLTVEAARKLSIFLNFVAAIDVECIDLALLTARTLSILRSSSLARSGTLHNGSISDRALVHYASYSVPTLLSALMPGIPASQHQHSYQRPRIQKTAWYRKWSGVLHLCVDVYCQLLLDGSLSRLQNHFRAAAAIASRVRLSPTSSSQPPTQSECQQEVGVYADCIALLTGIFEPILNHLNNHVTLDLLVDEMVSCAYDDDAEMEGATTTEPWISRTTRDEMRRLLRNTNLMGLPVYRAQLYEQYNTATTIERLWEDVSPSHRSHISALSHMLRGVWWCVNVESPPQSNIWNKGSTRISVFSSIQLLVAAQSVELGVVSAKDASGTLGLKIRTSWSFMPELSTVFVLDSRYHASNVLPTGLATSLWQQLGSHAVVGDYRGTMRQTRGEGDNVFTVFDLDVFSYTVLGPTNKSSYCLQLTFAPTRGSGRHATRGLEVHVRICRGGLCPTALAGLTLESRQLSMPLDELLRQASPEERSGWFVFPDTILSAVMVYEPAQAISY